jgi:perosamine synthetase
MFDQIVKFIREQYRTEEFIPLHEPRFWGNEKKYLNETIDSGFVSSVGPFVDKFEKMFATAVGAKFAVAVTNGTAALHAALKLAGVSSGDEVITQPLTFIATCNAISYLNANPVFVDVDRHTLGLSAQILRDWLSANVTVKQGRAVNKTTGKVIKACVPMHTFGLPCEIDAVRNLCDEFHIKLIEDAAESLGSYYKNKHTGRWGYLGVFSFNGNKIITTGGGGVIVTDDEDLAKRAKHLTTTAKVPHRWEYKHDEVGFNYRLPNVNAALGCAQLEQLESFVEKKRVLAKRYIEFFSHLKIKFISETTDCRSNYWLNAILLESKDQRDEFLKYSNDNGVMTRPSWELMHKLPMFKHCQTSSLANADWLSDRLVNIPSSVLP